MSLDYLPRHIRLLCDWWRIKFWQNWRALCPLWCACRFVRSLRTGPRNCPRRWRYECVGENVRPFQPFHTRSYWPACHRNLYWRFLHLLLREMLQKEAKVGLGRSQKNAKVRSWNLWFSHWSRPKQRGHYYWSYWASVNCGNIATRYRRSRGRRTKSWCYGRCYAWRGRIRTCPVKPSHCRRSTAW